MKWHRTIILYDEEYKKVKMTLWYPSYWILFVVLFVRLAFRFLTLRKPVLPTVKHISLGGGLKCRPSRETIINDLKEKGSQ